MSARLNLCDFDLKTMCYRRITARDITYHRFKAAPELAFHLALLLQRQVETAGLAHSIAITSTRRHPRFIGINCYRTDSKDR